MIAWAFSLKLPTLLRCTHTEHSYSRSFSIRLSSVATHLISTLSPWRPIRFSFFFSCGYHSVTGYVHWLSVSQAGAQSLWLRRRPSRHSFNAEFNCQFGHGEIFHAASAPLLFPHLLIFSSALFSFVFVGDHVSHLYVIASNTIALRRWVHLYLYKVGNWRQKVPSLIQRVRSSIFFREKSLQVAGASEKLVI